MKKKILVAAGIALVCSFATVAALLLELDSPELGKAALEKASRALGLKLKATRFRWNLLRGLELGDVEASSRFPGGLYQFRLQRMVLSHQLLPLLSGRVMVDRVAIDQPQMKIILMPIRSSSSRRVATIPENGKRPKAESAEGVDVKESHHAELVLMVSMVEIEDGSVVMHGENEDDVSLSLEGLGLELRALSFNRRALSLLHGLSAEGTIRVGTLSSPATQVQAVQGKLRLAGGRFDLSDLEFATNNGQFKVTMGLDFNQIPFSYRLNLKGDSLDLNTLAGGHRDDGFGPGALGFDAEGFGAESKNVKGVGSLAIERGKLPSHPVFSGIEEVLGRKGLLGSFYESTEASFRIEENQLILDQFTLETEQAALELSGSVDFEGPLALNLLVRVRRQYLENGDVSNRQTEDERQLGVPLLVTGSLDNPQVQLATNRH